MNDEKFRVVYERIVESYKMDFKAAKRLFQRILEILYGKDTDGG